MPVSYARQTMDALNPIARFTHRRRLALSLDTAATLAAQGSTVLDYGCGPGVFLRDLRLRRPDLTLVGYDPYFQRYYGEDQPGVDLVGSTADVPSGSVGLVTAFEVCEHLDDDQILEFLAESERVLVPGGRLLVSVPVIGGPVLLLKEANRVVFHRRPSDYGLRELAAAAFLGRPATRVPKDHKGFDFRALQRRIAGRFGSDRTWVSPFPSLPWYLNSQAFSVWTSGAVPAGQKPSAVSTPAART